MKVILLGTGGPRPDPRRNASTTLVQVGDENLLFDAGRGVVLQLVRAGIPLDAVKQLFITHHHFDHIGDIYDVILSTWMHGRKVPLNIFGPPDTRRIVDALLTQIYDKDWEWRSKGEPSFGPWQPAATEDVAPGLVIDTGKLKVIADTVIHGNGLGLPKAFLKRWNCYGYRIEAEGKIVTISGDTVPCEGIDRLAQGADVLVHCCYMASSEMTTEHFKRTARHTLASADTVGKTAARADVKTLVLTHHKPRTDDKILDEIASEVARDFKGRIIIGNDLTEIDV